MSKCLTDAQKKGREMRAKGRTYRGGYTRQQSQGGTKSFAELDEEYRNKGDDEDEDSDR